MNRRKKLRLIRPLRRRPPTLGGRETPMRQTPVLPNARFATRVHFGTPGMASVLWGVSPLYENGGLVD